MSLSWAAGLSKMTRISKRMDARVDMRIIRLSSLIGGTSLGPGSRMITCPPRRNFVLHHPSRSSDPNSSSSDTIVSEKSITSKLSQEFPDAQIRVEDISGGCGSFFVVEVIDKKFEGLSSLKQHQLINRTLSNEIPKIHGLRILTSTPDQSQ